MSKLFQPSNSRINIEKEHIEQLQQCYQEIALLKEQLSSQGIEHLLKVKELEHELEKSQHHINQIHNLRSSLEAQIAQVTRNLKDQYLKNQQIEKKLRQTTHNLQTKTRELIDLQSQIDQKSKEQSSESELQLKIDPNDITQEELILVNQKAQLLQLKNDALDQELKETQNELQELRDQHIQQIQKYEKKIQQITKNIQKINVGDNYLNTLKSQNIILHKQLQLKINEVDELRDKIETYQNELHSEKDLNVAQQNIEQYLEQALEQVQELRRENQQLKEQQPPDQNIKALKSQLILVKTQYSNSLRENNLLIQQNARLQKQKNQFFMEIQKMRREDNGSRQKAYAIVCEEKNQIQVELMNTYEQIEKLNDILIRKQQQINQLRVGFKQKPYISQMNMIKVAVQNAQLLQNNHWSNIQNKIQMLKSQNESLKRGSCIQSKLNQMHR